MENETKKTKLSVRIHGRENYYLNLTEGVAIELVLPDGHIMGSIACLGKNIIATKMANESGWNIQAVRKDGTSHCLVGVWRGVPETNEFIAEAKKEVE